MRHAVSIPPFTDAATIVDLAVDAERAGWDAVFVWDHVQWIAPLGLDVHDPWALLSAMAARTSRVRLGTCVTPVARRRPYVLARQLVTLDHLSHGRAMLGVGLGEPPDADFADVGEDPDPRVRAARLDEGLPIVAALAAGERVDHEGPYHRVHAQFRPPSVQRPRPPIFVAGIAPHRRPLQRALRWDGFFPLGPEGLLSPDEIADYLDGVPRPPGWELFAARTAGDPVARFADVGVTWLVEGAWPEGDWVEDLSRRIDGGPPR